jgi:hypothetical protein
MTKPCEAFQVPELQDAMSSLVRTRRLVELHPHTAQINVAVNKRNDNDNNIKSRTESKSANWPT